MAHEQAVLAHPTSEAEPGTGLRRVGRDGARLILGRQAESAQSAVERNLLQRIDKGLQALAVIHGQWTLNETLEDLGVRGVLQGLKGSAAGVGEPALGCLGALLRQPGQRGGCRRDRDSERDAAAANGGQELRW